MGALLCWIGVVLFAMLGVGGLLVGANALSLAAALVGAGSLLACWVCWRLARRLSAGQLASASGRAPTRRDEDDDDDSGGFASALLASSLPPRAAGPVAASLGPRAETAFEPLECKADAAEGDDGDRSDDCGSESDSGSSSDSSADSGSDNTSSD